MRRRQSPISDDRTRAGMCYTEHFEQRTCGDTASGNTVKPFAPLSSAAVAIVLCYGGCLLGPCFATGPVRLRGDELAGD